MRISILTSLLLLSTGFAFADPTEPTEIGFAEVRTLGTLNGQALACRQFDASSKAKAMMIGHAPKTRRYGTLFETATNAAFLAATKDDTPCPTDAELTARLAQSAAALKAIFPEQATSNALEPDPLEPLPLELEPSDPQTPRAEPSPSIDETGS